MRDNLEEIKLNEDAVVVRSYTNCADAISILMAAVSKAENIDNQYSKQMKLMSQEAYHLVAKSKRRIQMEFFKANPDINTAKFFMNQMEQPMNMAFMKLTFPKVKVNRVIQVPKL